MNSNVLPNQYMPQVGINSLAQNYQYPPMEVQGNQQGRNAKLNEFWSNIMIEINQYKGNGERHHDLPMARIKKIMKMDESVQSCMIGSEAPSLIAKACELFIRELTLQAWIHTEENKRRTLQKIDITTAASENEMYDFLIDFIPRDDSAMDYNHGAPKAPPYDPVVFMINNPNQMLDNPMNGIPNVPPYLPTNQTSSFQQGISTLIAPSQPSTFNQNVQPMPQQLPPTMPQSLQQPLPQTGNYLYMDNLPVSNPAVVQSATLMNSQMMGLT